MSESGSKKRSQEHASMSGPGCSGDRGNDRLPGVGDRPPPEDGGELDEVAGQLTSTVRITSEKLRFEARGHALIPVGIVVSAYIATLQDGQVAGLAAMGALVLVSIMNRFGRQLRRSRPAELDRISNTRGPQQAESIVPKTTQRARN
jgi:hypothetical protein